jgi:glucosamine--fructose-6-phosphate aminotransferase (isomerizing)
MCGIIGAIANRDISRILIDGLHKLEYRGYDSAGIALINKDSDIKSCKAVGKIEMLDKQLLDTPLSGHTGIAHTRWATHGKPNINNAHPHICRGEIAVVHNGIIENYELIRESLIEKGYNFQSDTDSEVISNLIHNNQNDSIDSFDVIAETISALEGKFAIAVIFKNDPNRIIAARQGSPLIVGVGNNEYFVASDIIALLSVTSKYISLEDGDIADIDIKKGITIYNSKGLIVQRSIKNTEQRNDVSGKEGFRHYMLKEIYEQASSIANTLENCIIDDVVQDHIFGKNASELFDKTRAIQIVACGTSYHAALVASYWIKSIAGLNCVVDIASEFRYGDALIHDGTLFITISQSGETADTLSALKKAKRQPYIGSLSICNVIESSLTRESDLVFLTRAGVEIGVASTKAFTTQLTAMLLLTLALAKRNGIDKMLEIKIAQLLATLPGRVSDVLKLDSKIAKTAIKFANKQHTLYLGRGSMLPIAMEGALKLKEISYIHAEAYAAGELKHGPLALVNEEMPVVVVAPKNDLLNKLISNIHEVSARDGELFVFADSSVNLEKIDDIHKIEIEPVNDIIAPIIFTIPLQLFAYHVAVLKGADIDQPRNLAKSVTVE